MLVSLNNYILSQGKPGPEMYDRDIQRPAMIKNEKLKDSVRTMWAPPVMFIGL